MKQFLPAAALLAVMSACAPVPPQTPMQGYLNRAAGAEIVMRDCPAYGGYASVAKMREDAEKNVAMAKKLGATQADVQASKKLVSERYAGTVILSGPVVACNKLMSLLALSGANPIE